MSSDTPPSPTTTTSIQIKDEDEEEETKETTALLKASRSSSKIDRERTSSEAIAPLVLLGYTLGHVLNDMTASIWFTYVLVFMEKQVNMSETNAGVVFLTGQFVDAIFNPLSGIIIDALPFESSRVYYVVLGSVGVALTFSLLFFVPEFLDGLSSGYRVLWYSSWASLFNIFWSFVQVSHFSLVDELASTTKSKLKLNKFGQVGSAVAAMMSFSIARLVFQLDMNIERQFTVLSFSVIAIGLLCVFLFASLVLGYVCKPVQDNNMVTEEKKKVVTTTPSDSQPKKRWYEFFCVREFYEAISLYTKARMVMIVVMTFLAPYLVACSNHDTGIKTAANAMILYHTFYCITVLSEFLFCQKAAAPHGRVFLMMSYGALCIASATLTTSIWAMDPMLHDGDGIHAVYIPITLCGIVAYYLVATSRTLVNEVSSKYNSTFIIGAAGFSEKAIIGIVVFLIQDAERKYDDGYWWSISLVPTFSALAGLILASICMFCRENPVRGDVEIEDKVKKSL